MITLTIPGIPPSLNQWSRMHWAKAARLKKQWEQDVYYASYSQRPKKPIRYAKVTITFYFKDRRRRDMDNYTPKFLMDGLVKAGIIQDDSWEHIGTPELLPEYDKDNPRVEIEIREVEHGTNN